MDDKKKKKTELIEELQSLRKRMTELEKICSEGGTSEEIIRLTQFTIDRGSDAAFWIGPDARFFYVNEAACRSLGYTREELLTMTVHDIDPNFPKELWKDNWKNLKKRRFYTHESLHRAKDGRIFPVEISTNFIRFGGREYDCAFARDISERKRAEEALRESETRFRTIINAAQDFIFIKDPLLRYTLVNPAMELLFDKPAEELIGKTDFDLFGVESGKEIQEIDHRILSGEVIEEERTRIVGGKAFALHSIKAPMYAPDGGITGLFGIARDITGRKRREKALRESEARYRNLFENAPIGIGIATMEGRLLSYNELLKSLVGFENSEIKKINLRDLYLNPGDRKRFLERLSEERVVRDFETELKRKDESSFPVSITAVRMSEENGGNIYAMIQDITARKQSENALRASEENYRTIFDSANDSILIHDIKTGDILDVNQKMCEVFGYKREEIRQLTITDISSNIPPYTQKDALQRIREAAKNHPQIFEWQAKTRNGRLFWQEINLKQIQLGGKDRLLAVARDITDRKEAEETIRSNEQLLRSILDSTGDGILVVDEHGQIINTNANFANLWQIPRELIDTGDDKILLDYVLSQLADPEAFLVKVQALYQSLDEDLDNIQFKDGRTFERYSCPLILENKPAGRIWSFRDITERRQAEEALIEAHNSLEHKVRERTDELKKTYEQLLHAEKLSAVGKLSASIAHEFNNPIFGIRNVLERIGKREPVSSAVSELVNMAIRECNRIRDLTRDLQSFNSPTTGVVVSTDLHKAIDDILLLYRKELNSRGIKLLKRFSPDMPMIEAIPDQLKQVVLNLLSNAEESITEEEGIITISTGVADENTVVMSVVDNGVGIKPENLEHIFEPFFTTKPAVKGTGLGLSVAYGIIKRHSGAIDIESEIGSGTTVTVKLPIRTIKSESRTDNPEPKSGTEYK